MRSTEFTKEKYNLSEGWFTSDHQKYDEYKGKNKIFSQGFIKNFNQLVKIHSLSDIISAYINANDGNPNQGKENYTWTDHTIIHDFFMKALDILEKKYPQEDNFFEMHYKEACELAGRMVIKTIKTQPPIPISFDDTGNLKGF